MAFAASSAEKMKSTQTQLFAVTTCRGQQGDTESKEWALHIQYQVGNQEEN